MFKLQLPTFNKYFREPKQYDFPDGKCDATWELEFGYGEVATIYNWKNGVNYLGEDGQLTENITDWHIGGHSKM